MNVISNVELWNAVRANNPTFASHTAEATADLFTERGWSTITQSGMQTLNEFFALAMTYYLQLVNISHAKDPLEENGVGEYFDAEWGEYIQRMAVNSIKPISPQFRNLVDGSSPDQFVVRKPSVSNRFFQKNFDYQSLMTIPDKWEFKRVFISPFGFSEVMAGLFQGLENGYILQNYMNKLEVINAAINGAGGALSPYQTVTNVMDDTPTAEQLIKFQLSVMNIVELMTTSAQTGNFNSLGFESTQDISRLKLLVRPGYKANLALNVVRGSYNADTLNLPVDVVVVPHFGGLQPYKEAGFTTKLYPVYDKLGTQIGYNEADGQTDVTVENDEVFWKDPNADTYAVLADKGFIFQTRQNPYQVEPVRNALGLYTNYIASCPDNNIAYDPLYNMVLFKTTASSAG